MTPNTASIVLLAAITLLGGCAGATIDREQVVPQGSKNKTTKDATQSKTSSGFYAKDDIERPIRQRSDDIRLCYEAQLEKSPGLAGRLDLSWTIAKDGSVTELTSKGISEVAPCVENIIQVIRFRPPYGTTQKVSDYPFVFKAE